MAKRKAVDCSELSKATAEHAYAIADETNINDIDSILVEMQKEFPEFTSRDELRRVILEEMASHETKERLESAVTKLKRQAQVEATAIRVGAKRAAHMDQTAALARANRERAKARAETKKEEAAVRRADKAVKSASDAATRRAAHRTQAGALKRLREAEAAERRAEKAAELEEKRTRRAARRAFLTVEQDEKRRAESAERERRRDAANALSEVEKDERKRELARIKAEERQAKEEYAASDAGKIEKTEAKIKELQARIAEGKFEAPVAKVPEHVSKSLEAVRRHERSLRIEIRHRIEMMKPRTKMQYAMEVAHISRAMKTMLDFSAVLRQGGIIAISNPQRVPKAFWKMILSLSPAKHHDIYENLMERDNALLYERYGLYLAPPDTYDITRQEEHYMGNLIQAKFFRALGIAQTVNASNRAYSTFLNVLRADSFDAMSEGFKNREMTKEEGVALAHFINVLTGRGSLGPAESAAQHLNTVFFAPRYIMSRIEFLALQPVWGRQSSTVMRGLMIREYAKYVRGLGAMYLLIHLFSGGEDDDEVSVEFDPRSSDGGKIKIGAMRLDPLSGLQQIVRYTSQLLPNWAGGGVRRETSSRKLTRIDRGDVFLRGLLRSKLSPLTGTIVDIIDQEDFIGRDINHLSWYIGHVTPFSLREIADALVEYEGWTKPAAASAAAIFGMGVLIYDDKESRKDIDRLNRLRKKYGLPPMPEPDLGPVNNFLNLVFGVKREPKKDEPIAEVRESKLNKLLDKAVLK